MQLISWVRWSRFVLRTWPTSQSSIKLLVVAELAICCYRSPGAQRAQLQLQSALGGGLFFFCLLLSSWDYWSRVRLIHSYYNNRLQYPMQSDWVPAGSKNPRSSELIDVELNYSVRNWCCFHYFVRNSLSLVALLEALSALKLMKQLRDKSKLAQLVRERNC